MVYRKSDSTLRHINHSPDYSLAATERWMIQNSTNCSSLSSANEYASRFPVHVQRPVSIPIGKYSNDTNRKKERDHYVILCFSVRATLTHRNLRTMLPRRFECIASDMFSRPKVKQDFDASAGHRTQKYRKCFYCDVCATQPCTQYAHVDSCKRARQKRVCVYTNCQLSFSAIALTIRNDRHNESGVISPAQITISNNSCSNDRVFCRERVNKR